MEGEGPSCSQLMTFFRNLGIFGVILLYFHLFIQVMFTKWHLCRCLSGNAPCTGQTELLLELCLQGIQIEEGCAFHLWLEYNLGNCWRRHLCQIVLHMLQKC